MRTSYHRTNRGITSMLQDIHLSRFRYPLRYARLIAVVSFLLVMTIVYRARTNVSSEGEDTPAVKREKEALHEEVQKMLKDIDARIELAEKEEKERIATESKKLENNATKEVPTNTSIIVDDSVEKNIQELNVTSNISQEKKVVSLEQAATKNITTTETKPDDPGLSGSNVTVVESVKKESSDTTDVQGALVDALQEAVKESQIDSSAKEQSVEQALGPELEQNTTKNLTVTERDVGTESPIAATDVHQSVDLALNVSGLDHEVSKPMGLTDVASMPEALIKSLAKDEDLDPMGEEELSDASNRALANDDNTIGIEEPDTLTALIDVTEKDIKDDTSAAMESNGSKSLEKGTSLSADIGVSNEVVDNEDKHAGSELGDGDDGVAFGEALKLLTESEKLDDALKKQLLDLGFDKDLEANDNPSPADDKITESSRDINASTGDYDMPH